MNAPFQPKDYAPSSDDCRRKQEAARNYQRARAWRKRWAAYQAAKAAHDEHTTNAIG